jgi:hypothetical protein
VISGSAPVNFIVWGAIEDNICEEAYKNELTLCVY